MENLMGMYLSTEVAQIKKKIWDCNTTIGKINHMIFEVNSISKTVNEKLDLLEEKIRKYLDTEKILECEEKRVLSPMEFEPLEFMTPPNDLYDSEVDFVKEAERIGKILKLKAALVNLTYLCLEEIDFTLDNLAFKELEIMDAFYESVSLFRAYNRRVDLEHIEFFYGLRETKYEPILEQKHSRHIACLYRLLLIGRKILSSELFAKPTDKITRDDCRNMKEFYEQIVKEQRDASLLRTLCYEELKGKRASDDIKLFQTAYQLEV